ncbi:tRNA (adenosine(37)-N6)-threonylcarbamoyltransferase complex dimerization subunit type 1 TsaB [candidate division WOR-3 bacterium]|nr:tRNA (adenosine(37)-N6)-threonylcarbamoyltransferase complex dimerization subunit type 1 TsaB [candidate division WOR-3 bacterium]
MTTPGGFILGIDTSGRRTGLALVRDREKVGEQFHEGIDHNEVLPGMLKRLLAGAGIGPAALAAIGVVQGPGMFTALRVGLAWTAAIGLARGIPVKGVNTLAALAAGAGDDRPVLAVVDARKGQVYAAVCHRGRELIEPGLFLPPDLAFATASLSLPGTIVVAGNATDTMLPLVTATGTAAVDSGIRSPAPSVVAGLAASHIAGEGADDPAALAPVYLRRTDAELARERSGRP